MKLSKIIYIFSAMLALSGCGKKKTETPVQLVLEEKANTDHKWFYFTDGSYKETDLPQHSPIQSLKPWTESIRICDGNMDAEGNGILLVNRFGIMYFKGEEEPALIQDHHLFSESTAGNLVFENSIPFFTLSKNSFFNKKAAKDTFLSNHVIRFNQESGMFLPAVTYGDLKIQENSEISGTYYDGKSWVSSIKSSDGHKISFDYIKWTPSGEMAALSPVTQAGKIQIKEISEDEYRKICSPSAFNKAPARVKELLASIPSSFGFSLVCRNAGGSSPRFYTNGVAEDGDTQTLAYSILTPELVCAVFGDGTAYFKGSLKGRELLNNGKVTAFRLPKLPVNYVYGDFCISGDYLVISWEENDFYKTGRSGFLTVNMAKLFYSE